MALSAAQRAALTAAAQREGVEPDKLIAAAESAVDESAPATPAEVQPAEVKVFAYHFPFLRVNEVRELIGLSAIEDGDLWTGEWLAKHGGTPPTPAA